MCRLDARARPRIAQAAGAASGYAVVCRFRIPAPCRPPAGVKELGLPRVRRRSRSRRSRRPPPGKDLLACAMTGSGKTAAFLLPDPPPPDGEAARHDARAGPDADARAGRADPRAPRGAGGAHAGHRAPRCSAAWGWGRRSTRFRSGVDVIVATPGRLLDHLRIPYARFDRLEVLVLDEADRMLDMGFLPDIRRILAQLPAKRQTLFFSATMPREIVAPRARDAPRAGHASTSSGSPRPPSGSRRRSTRSRAS